MPEDEEEEELLPSQGHEAEGVEGQCWVLAAWSLGPFGLTPAGQSTPRGICAHGDLELHMHASLLLPASIQL